ncbi:MAG: hypothetical protein HZC14_00845 [Candidatus Niyogibacteria bacterium]|nr:hypothetical protein [Candidatus Niyogibacteria bacterium]
MNSLINLKQNIILKANGFFIALFGGSSKKSWIYLVAVLLGLMVGVLFFDAWIFWNETSAAFENISVWPIIQTEAINRDTLDKIIGVLRDREKRFNDVLSAPPVKDPSL